MRTEALITGAPANTKVMPSGIPHPTHTSLGTPTALPVAAAAPPSNDFGTVLPIIAAAVGWFLAAWFAFLFNRRLERERGEHERRGTQRQMRTLLRRLLAVMDPFFWPFKTLQLNDAVVTYQQLLEHLSERQTAIALDDDEYDAMDSLLARYGQMVALAQTFWREWEEQNRENPGATERQRRIWTDHLRRMCAECFEDALGSMDAAVELFGDDAVTELFEKMKTRAATFVAQMREEESDPSRAMGEL